MRRSFKGKVRLRKLLHTAPRWVPQVAPRSNTQNGISRKPDMAPRNPLVFPSAGLSRRRFVQGLTAGGVLSGLSLPAMKALAQAGQLSRGTAPVLRGNTFDLVIAESPVNFTGQPGVATTINGSLPAPTLRWREGEEVTIHGFGKFAPATRAARVGRNPQTGEAINIPARVDLTFKAGKQVKDKLNG